MDNIAESTEFSEEEVNGIVEAIWTQSKQNKRYIALLEQHHEKFESDPDRHDLDQIAISLSVAGRPTTPEQLATRFIAHIRNEHADKLGQVGMNFQEETGLTTAE